MIDRADHPARGRVCRAKLQSPWSDRCLSSCVRRPAGTIPFGPSDGGGADLCVGSSGDTRASASKVGSTHRLGRNALGLAPNSHAVLSASLVALRACPSAAPNSRQSANRKGSMEGGSMTRDTIRPQLWHTSIATRSGRYRSSAPMRSSASSRANSWGEADCHSVGSSVADVCRIQAPDDSLMSWENRTLMPAGQSHSISDSAGKNVGKGSHGATAVDVVSGGSSMAEQYTVYRRARKREKKGIARLYHLFAFKPLGDRERMAFAVEALRFSKTRKITTDFSLQKKKKKCRSKKKKRPRHQG